ncbi:NAD(P)H-hydrate dehydratase [Pedobacter sp. AW31-3R]|uniref:NAD(P)H-hydrate dehydratase n=1 Tax=Pedobacter sp. AW31-3R TaxID=3445781 RepID=UPI003FA14BAC
MQNLLSSAQMRDADKFTIQKKGISSIELMEIACIAFTAVFMQEVKEKETPIAVVCGQGNNGADGLAIARLLRDAEYLNISVYLTQFSEKETEEYRINLNLLKKMGLPLVPFVATQQLGRLDAEVVIDAVLGSGLNKPLKGEYAALALFINSLPSRVISVDVPSGFPAEGSIPQDLICIHAELVVCFQRPKINFFFPESLTALKKFTVADIGLDEDFIQRQESAYHLTDSQYVQGMLKPRALFSHKGTYGHALIVAGQAETMGAALLSAKGCLNSGAGLTTLSIPQSGLTALNTALPEVMYKNREEFAEGGGMDKFKAVAIGPGLGIGEESIALLQVFLKVRVPLVIDADALHMLGERRDLLALLPEGVVLTPHMKEFDHLFGQHTSWWERLQTARRQARKMACTIVLKNQYTFVVCRTGEVYINPTGNPAMAQGGMGDVLTGVLVAFIAQGYTCEEASVMACYLHGASGDLLAEKNAVVTASTVAKGISVVLKGLIR